MPLSYLRAGQETVHPGATSSVALRVMPITRVAGHLNLTPQDLPGRPLGQGVHQPDPPRILVRRDPVPGERAQFLWCRAGARLQRHSGADLLAQIRMRDADHGHLGDGRVLVQHLLDLPRVHVVAAPDDQVLLPVDDVVVAVGVHPGHVAGAEPSVGDRLGGGLGLVPVALHHVVAADGDLADLPARHVWPASSTSRISTPSMGVPMEPGLRTLSGWLNDATGEVSESP